MSGLLLGRSGLHLPMSALLLARSGVFLPKSGLLLARSGLLLRRSGLLSAMSGLLWSKKHGDVHQTHLRSNLPSHPNMHARVVLGNYSLTNRHHLHGSPLTGLQLPVLKDVSRKDTPDQTIARNQMLHKLLARKQGHTSAFNLPEP